MIEIRNLEKTFGTGAESVAAVRGISITIPSGEFFTLVGPSGCGKTTTLRMLAGLERPTQGEIIIAGETVYSSDRKVFIPPNKRSVGMVFQSYAIWPHMTVFENVAFPLRVRKTSKGQVAEKVHDVLELVGLGDVAERPAPKLSGGQQQRVAFARALLTDPDVLLLDEPLSNLDAQLRTQMRDELKQLQARLGITTVYVTHDQDEALSLSDELAVMSEGKIMQRGGPHDVYWEPYNRFAAKFIGAANLLEASIESGEVAEGENVVETSIGALRVRSPRAGASEQGIWVCVRPEAIALRSGQDLEGENVFLGTVERVTFLGDHFRYEVEVGSEMLRVSASSLREIKAGSAVTVSLPSDRCIVVWD